MIDTATASTLDKEQSRFVSLLALELDNGDIYLPSLPDVVLKIRKLLESDSCDLEQVSKAVSVDAVLVSRLLVLANSAFFNRANIKIETLDMAIGRLGFETLRNTAMSLAMKQLYSADKKGVSAGYLRQVWARGMKLSCMAHSVALKCSSLNSETAYLCGLMHEVGKLYILTKAGDFPEFLGDSTSLTRVMQEWSPPISKSIIESWGFPDEVAESTATAFYVDTDTESAASFVDIMVVAKLLIDGDEERLSSHIEQDASCIKLNFSEQMAAEVLLAYREKLQTMQQSLA